MENVAVGSLLGDRYELQTLFKSTPAMLYGDAIDTRTGKPVTVHLFHSKIPAATRWKEQFMADARRLAGLPPSDLAAVVDHFAVGDGLALVSEGILGQPLITEGERQDPATVTAWAADIATLMNFLHHRAEPVYLRLSRPDPLWRKLNGAATLLRYGVPEPPAATTMTSDISPYQAPEAFGNLARAATAAADSYWLGAVMLLALNGRKPPTGPDRAARKLALSRTEGVPDEVWKLIGRMVAIAPQDRPGAEEMQKRLIQLQV